MSKSLVVRALQEMADLMEVESDNPFRARSYRNAARVLDAISDDLGELIESGRLRDTRGIGSSIAGDVLEIYRQGDSARYRQLLEAVPRGVREMLRIPGLGPKKVRSIWRELGITSIDKLEEASNEDRVASLKGFGSRSQAKILQGIEYLRTVSGRFLIPEAEAFASVIVEHLRAHPAVSRLEVAGSYRRRNEVIKDLDFLVATEAPGEVREHFSRWEGIRESTAGGETKVSVRLESGMAADLRLVSDEQFPFALAHFTGSKEHNAAMRARAKELGLKLNEYGLFPAGKERSLKLGDEEGIYRALGLAYVPPELRENRGELEMAERGELPRLVEEDDIRGVVHLHTTYSDGRATLEEMVEAAKARGYSYIAVADHSQSAFYAGGLREADIRRQHKEIDRLNAAGGDFLIFKGIEADIRADGSLDYPPRVLDLFDFVIASLHSSLSQPEDRMTRRVLRALEDPHTTLLGHATARLLLQRDGVALNIEKVLAKAADLGVAVEINANPRRLDLDWRHGPRARELGLYTSINPDAHSPAGIDDIRYGVGIARKAAFEPSRVVNAYAAAGFAEFISRRKRKGS